MGHAVCVVPGAVDLWAQWGQEEWDRWVQWAVWDRWDLVDLWGLVEWDQVAIWVLVGLIMVQWDQEGQWVECDQDHPVWVDQWVRVARCQSVQWVDQWVLEARCRWDLVDRCMVVQWVLGLDQGLVEECHHLILHLLDLIVCHLTL